MDRRRRWLLVALALVLSGNVAVAETPPPAPASASPSDPSASQPTKLPDQPSKPPDDVKPPQKAAPTEAAKPANGATDAVVVDSASLDAISGRSVKSPTGEDMGRIVDVLVAASGDVRAAVVDFGGFLGVGSRKIAVGWKALDFADLGKGGNVIVALTRNQLRMAPEYKQGNPIVILEASPAEAKPSVEAKEPPAPAHPAPVPAAPTAIDPPKK